MQTTLPKKPHFSRFKIAGLCTHPEAMSSLKLIFKCFYFLLASFKHKYPR